MLGEKVKDYETGYDMLEKYPGLEHFLFDELSLFESYTPKNIVNIKRFVSSKGNQEKVYNIIFEDMPWKNYKKATVIYNSEKGFKLYKIQDCTKEVLKEYGVAS